MGKMSTKQLKKMKKELKKLEKQFKSSKADYKERERALKSEWKKCEENHLKPFMKAVKKAKKKMKADKAAMEKIHAQLHSDAKSDKKARPNTSKPTASDKEKSTDKEDSTMYRQSEKVTNMEIPAAPKPRRGRPPKAKAEADAPAAPKRRGRPPMAKKTDAPAKPTARRGRPAGSGKKPAAKPAAKSAAKPASTGARGRTRDDLTRIEGVGPKVADLLRDNGIRTFHALSKASVAKLQNLLSKGGRGFWLRKPDTWPEQAGLAASKDWEALDKMQAELRGGNRK